MIDKISPCKREGSEWGEWESGEGFTFLVSSEGRKRSSRIRGISSIEPAMTGLHVVEKKPNNPQPYSTRPYDVLTTHTPPPHSTQTRPLCAPYTQHTLPPPACSNRCHVVSLQGKGRDRGGCLVGVAIVVSCPGNRVRTAVFRTKPSCQAGMCIVEGRYVRGSACSLSAGWARYARAGACLYSVFSQVLFMCVFLLSLYKSQHVYRSIVCLELSTDIR